MVGRRAFGSGREVVQRVAAGEPRFGGGVAGQLEAVVVAGLAGGEVAGVVAEVFVDHGHTLGAAVVAVVDGDLVLFHFEELHV